MKEKTNQVSRAKQDLLIIFVFSILVFFISAQFDLHEILDKIYYTKYKIWNLDETAVLLAFLGFACIIYSYRRIKETKYALAQRIRAEENTQQQIMRIRTLQSIDSKILSDVPIRDILKTVIKNVPKELGGDVVAISLLGNGMHFVRLPSGDIIGEDVLSISEDMMEWFEKQKEAIAVYDLEFEPRVQIRNESIQNLKLASYLGVPMVVQDRTIGIMHLLTQHSKDFAKEDLDFFTTLAGQAAIAVERSKAIETLGESEERYRRLVEQSPYGIAIHNEGKLMYVNLAGAKILGAGNPEELVGKTVLEIIHPDFCDIVKERIRMQEDGKLALQIEEKFLKLDGTPVDVEVTSISINYKGKPSMYDIFHDITERRRAEELRIEKERLEYASRAKSDFLASMSHELRTPLNAVLGFSQLLNDGVAGELNDKQKHFIDNVIKSGKFLLNLINDILDLSKIEAGKIELNIEKIPISSTIDEAIILIKEKAAKHNITIKKEIDSGLEFVEADKQRIKQILFNLLSNAVKFSKEDGGTVTTSAKKEEDMAQISVSDTGIGIKPENMEKLFQKFEQLEKGISQKYGGTGLGLAISKQLVELHGGKIWAESKYGEGSMFTFTLPLKAIKEVNK